MSQASLFVSSNEAPTRGRVTGGGRMTGVVLCLVATLVMGSAADGRVLEKRTPWGRTNAAESAKATGASEKSARAAEPTPTQEPVAVAEAAPESAPAPVVAEAAPEFAPAPMVEEFVPESKPAPMVEEVVPESKPAPVVAESPVDSVPAPVVAESPVDSAPAPVVAESPVEPTSPVAESVPEVAPVAVAEPVAVDSETNATPEVSSPPRWQPPPPTGPTGALAGEFSGQRAYAHLEQLVAIGPRVSGTAGAQKARDYIRTQLEAVGAEVVETRVEFQLDPELPVRELVHLTGVLPGASSDIFLMAAPYDTFPVEGVDYVGANEGGSGPALLLELARALSAYERGYTVGLAFIDGESIPAKRKPNARSFAGSRSFAATMAGDGALAKMRAGFFFDQVADPDLRIARDLRSHRAFRETVWQAAFDLDRVDAFPPGAPFESPELGHRAFIAMRFPRVVAMMDNRFGGDETPGVYARTAEDDLDHTSPESLGTVGAVALEAFSRIERRLAKIDRFVSRRTPEPPASPDTLD